MSDSDYMKTRHSDFAAQLQTFALHIGSYAEALNLTSAQIMTQATDAAYFQQVLKSQEIANKQALQWTAWRTLIREGGSSDLAAAPTPVNLTGSVPPVAPGVEPRFRALVKHIKAQPAYNTGIGEILGIERPTSAPPDFSQLKPQLRLELRGDGVLIRWGWQGNRAHLSMIELQVSQGDTKAFETLAYDTTPDYLDTSAMPSTPTRRTYRAIYRAEDQRVGLWSDEVAITLGA